MYMWVDHMTQTGKQTNKVNNIYKYKQNKQNK